MSRANEPGYPDGNSLYPTSSQSFPQGKPVGNLPLDTLVALIASRNSLETDNGVKLAANSASPISYSLVANTITTDMIIPNKGAGALTVQQGTGTTCFPSTISTTAANQSIAIIVTGLNEYQLKLSS